MFYQNRPFHLPYNNQNAFYQSPTGLCRPTMDSSTSSQTNQPYSLLNRVNLDMDFDQLLYSQEYYPTQDYSMSHGSAHGSTPVDDDDSHVEEMSPIKAKNPSRRASKAKGKEPPKDWTTAKEIALCEAWYFEKKTGSTRGYDSILSKWKDRVRPRIGSFYAIINNIEQNHESGEKKSKTSKTTSGSASDGFDLKNEADEYEEEIQEKRAMGCDLAKAKKKSFVSSHEGSSSFDDLIAGKFLNMKKEK
nr:hypothetical protein [Tanacetum cinerariifolium]